MFGRLLVVTSDGLGLVTPEILRLVKPDVLVLLQGPKLVRHDLVGFGTVRPRAWGRYLVKKRFVAGTEAHI